MEYLISGGRYASCVHAGGLSDYLPPAYIVRREGNSFTLFVCPHRGEGGSRYPPGGVPGSGTPPGGYPGQEPPWGGTRVRYPPGGVVPGSGTPLGGVPGSGPPSGVPGPPRGGTRVRYPPGGYPGQVPPLGGYLVGGTRVRYPPGGVPGSGTPPGGTRVGQQKEYSLHGGRYASCVHAGGLSCIFFYFCKIKLMKLINLGSLFYLQFNCGYRFELSETKLKPMTNNTSSFNVMRV